MYCSKCGNELKKDDTFCPRCGTKVGVKKKLPIFIFVIIGVLIIIIVLLLINFNLFRRRIRNSGHFEKVDGVDTYKENGQVVTNSLVRIRGRKVYFVDENGHKKKNTWEIIDNDGTYGYFGSLGELVVNKIREIDGKEYYFNEEGKLITDQEVEIDGIKYKANSNGELYTLDEYIEAETIKKETVLAKVTPTTKAAVVQTVVTQAAQTIQIVPTEQATQNHIVITYAKETTSAKIEETEKREPSDGKLTEESENLGPGAGIVDTYKKSYVDDEIDSDSSNSENEVKVKSTEKISDTVSDDEYECKITLVKPIMQGKNYDETEVLNSSIDELMDIMWEDVESIVNDYDSLPKSVTFSVPTLGTVSKTRIIINLPGSLTTRSGSTKNIKYRITYDRDEENGDIAKVS